VTWSDEQGSLVQEGVALRIVPAENGDVRAITVTKNVRLGLFFIFNVHVWDSTAETPFTQVGGANLEDVFLTESGLAPLPWRLCARVIGTKLDFKAWPIAAPEPAWNDGRYGASLTLPEGWNAPGYAGWYVGHLESGGSVRYSDMGTWKYVVADPTTTSSSTTSSTTTSSTTTSTSTTPTTSATSTDPAVDPAVDPGFEAAPISGG